MNAAEKNINKMHFRQHKYVFTTAQAYLELQILC